MRAVSVVVSLVVLFLSTDATNGFMRISMEDATVLEQSELVVVARLKEGSIHIPDNEDGCWPFHATLVIANVLKGKCDQKEIPIAFAFGLTPVVGGSRIDRNPSQKGVVEIFDTGNSTVGWPSLVKDARQDNLWFLSELSLVDRKRRKSGKGTYAVAIPEQVRPLSWKDYIVAYMSDDPEKEIQRHANGKDAWIAQRAKRYLDHREVQRILTIEDPAERYEKLLPFFLRRTTWGVTREAADGIKGCGKVGGKRLEEVFLDPKHRDSREEIIIMWRWMEYREAVPVLIDQFQHYYDAYWKGIRKGWEQNPGSDETQSRILVYREMRYAITTLVSLKDPAAKDAIAMTRDRWKAVDPEGQGLVRDCDEALRVLSAAGTAQPNAAVGRGKARPREALLEK